LNIDQYLEYEVVAAVQNFAKSVNTHDHFDANMEVLTKVTSNLKLSRLDF